MGEESIGVALSTPAEIAAEAPLAGRLTGLPHFEQNSAPSGRVDPHLLHARVARRADDGLAGIVEFTTAPHRKQNWAPSGRLAAHWLHNTAGTLHSGNHRE